MLSMRLLRWSPRRALVMVMMSSVLLLVGCASGDEGSTSVNRIVYGLTLSPSGFDPHINQSSEMGIVLRQIYDTLLYRDPSTGGFVAGLATTWAISEDQRVYTFELRQGVRFHDDTPFNAQAVAANLNRITAAETRSQNAAALLGPYDGYTIVDEYTIEIRLTEPYAPLLDSLSQFYLGMASPAALDEYGLERYQFNQVGTGPYRFVEYIPDERVVIRRNLAYAWGPSFYQAPAQGQIDEVEFRFFRDPATRLAALEQGVVQVMGEIPPGDARVLIGNTSFRIVSTTVAGQPDQLMMNTARPPLDNRSFRQTLMLGTNRAAIVDSLYQGFSTAADGVLTNGTQFYNAAFSGLYPFDMQQARALMSTLGYVDADNNGYLDTPEGDLTLTMIVPPWGEYRQVAQFLQDQWADIGVGIELVSVPDFPTLLNEVGEGEYHLVPFNSYGVDPAFLSTYYTTGAVRNFTGYGSPNLDALLIEAGRQLDPSVRGELYTQAQTLIAEEALILPLRDRVNLTGVSVRVENLQYDSYGWYPILYNASYQP